MTRLTPRVQCTKRTLLLYAGNTGQGQPAHSRSLESHDQIACPFAYGIRILFNNHFTGEIDIHSLEEGNSENCFVLSFAKWPALKCILFPLSKLLV